MERIIEALNEAIQSEISTISGKVKTKLYGLAEPVLVRDSDNEVTQPAIVSDNGECHIVYEECDHYDLTAYHRLQSISYEEAENGYGSRRTYNQTADISLVLIGRRRLNRSAIEAVVRNALSSDNRVVLTGTDFNAVQVFASEFSGLPYFINADFFLFKVNYRITSAQMNGCNK